MLCVTIILLSDLQIVLDLASESSFKPATFLCPFDMGSFSEMFCFLAQEDVPGPSCPLLAPDL